MQAFDELRARAREQLDSAIVAARNQYKQTLAQIATIEDVIVKDKDKTRLLKLRTEPAPNSTTLREAMIDALRDRKLSAVELAVAVRESGYKTSMSHRRYCQQVRFFLHKDKRFKKDCDKWSLVRRA